jgi:S1-C subfamily serine protease
MIDPYNNFKKEYIAVILVSVIFSSIFGGFVGYLGGSLSNKNSSLTNTLSEFYFGKKASIPSSNKSQPANTQIVQVDYEIAVENAVQKVSPAVVSIIITKNLPIIEQNLPGFFGSDFFNQFFGIDNPQTPQKGMGTQKTEVGGGTGFIVSADGYIITNKHVVSDQQAEYTVLMNDETKHAAKVLSLDPINDIAILKIESKDLPFVEFGDSSNLKVGQSVITIGNALGEFRNTVSTGVISGLARSITAGGQSFGSEDLVGVIQTDASINPGNSGGPLVNLSGQVIGMNTAMAQGAENIGFTIPINEVRAVYESVKKFGHIVRPWLGVRYVQIDKTMADQNKLSVDYGVLIVRGQNQTELAVIPGSPADKAGLVENDIILEINGKKIDAKNPLAKTISQLKVGDEISLKVLSKGKEKTVKVKLEEMK